MEPRCGSVNADAILTQGALRDPWAVGVKPLCGKRVFITPTAFHFHSPGSARRGAPWVLVGEAASNRNAVPPMSVE